jgi:uncharacterized protein (DUF1697 family)
LTITGQIERHLEECLGFEVPTLIRTLPEMKAVAAFDPMAVGEDLRPEDSTYVLFLPDVPSGELQARLQDLQTEDDRFKVIGREVYWLIRGKLSESPLFAGGLAKALTPVPNTMRNMTSVRKMVEKHLGGPED